jgi:glyoxylase-like metal-dependent hydrolase (beta-lactamase superfamily II)
MALSKATFVLIQAFVIAAASALSMGARAAPGDATAELSPVAPGVYVRAGALEDWGPGNLGRVSNQGVVVGDRCAAVIDTSGTPADGKRLADAVHKVTERPICYVISTHAHPDHVLGNQAFASEAAAGGGAASAKPEASAATGVAARGSPAFVGHARLAAALQARGPYYLNALQRDFGPEHAGARLIAPDTPVADVLELDLGNRTLRVNAWKTAHTDSDLTVLDTATGTLFLGDLLFIDHVPVLDGSLKGWFAAMEALAGWKVQIAVPGHGAPTNDLAGALDAQRRYLDNLRSQTRAAIKGNMPLSRAVERIGPDRPQWKLLETFHKRNVTAAYAELEWED